MRDFRQKRKIKDIAFLALSFLFMIYLTLVVAPSLVSAPSDLKVALGFALTVVAPCGFVYYNVSRIKRVLK